MVRYAKYTICTRTYLFGENAELDVMKGRS
jgi:hypothetical protein